MKSFNRLEKRKNRRLGSNLGQLKYEIESFGKSKNERNGKTESTLKR